MPNNIKQVWDNLSDEERKQRAENAAAGCRRFWARLTPDERAARGRKISDALREAKARKTDAQLQVEHDNRANAARECWSKKTKKQRRAEGLRLGASRQKAWQSSSEEEKQAFRDKMSTIRRDWWATRTEEELEVFAQAVSIGVSKFFLEHPEHRKLLSKKTREYLESLSPKERRSMLSDGIKNWWRTASHAVRSKRNIRAGKSIRRAWLTLPADIRVQRVHETKSAVGRGVWAVVNGTRIKFDSRWEVWAYRALTDLFPDVQYNADIINLTRADESGLYSWTPDFIIPSAKLIIEVKGHPVARKTWDTVIAPAILNTPEMRRYSIALIDYNPGPPRKRPLTIERLFSNLLWFRFHRRYREHVARRL